MSSSVPVDMKMASEKEQGEHLEHGSSNSHSSIEKNAIGDGCNDSNQPNYKDKETKRILRKVDWRLVPMLTLLYLMAFLDRGNIANAKVAGMDTDLNLSGSQYNLALTVFFFPYAIFEVPSNIVLKLIRPSLWISIMMVSWGIVMTMMGIVEDYHGLIITRVFLGLCEAGLFPAATYLLTTWYCRFEVQSRMSVFFSAASMAGAFSGLLAFAIEKMEGVGGLAGWRWIFILEGIITVCIGTTLYWTLPDSPAAASFLTPEERLVIKTRLEQDSGTNQGKVTNEEKFQWKFLRSALFEWKIWVAVIVYWGNSICLYGFTYSAPTIIKELGYTAANAQLLTIPVYLVGVISTVFFSVMADKQQVRWRYIVIPYSIALCGLIGLLAIPHPRLPGLTYAFLFTIPGGVYPPLICILAWIGNNLAPSWRRSVGMALLISIGNLGGAIGSNIFLEKQQPHYWLGYGFAAGIISAAIICTFVLRFAFLRENRKRDRMDPVEIRARYSEQELLDMGDKSPFYRYVI